MPNFVERRLTCDLFAVANLYVFSLKNTGTSAIRCTTDLVSVREGSGWTMFAAMVLRRLFTSAHIADGEFTTVIMLKMSLFPVTSRP